MKTPNPRRSGGEKEEECLGEAAWQGPARFRLTPKPIPL